MCDQNNLNDQSVTNLELKGLMCDKKKNLANNLLQSLNLKDSWCNLTYIFSFTIMINS